jgi:hypothetical protein
MPLNLKRTAEALAAWDTFQATQWWHTAQTDGDVWKAVAIEARLGKAVGHAFGLDTADRNALDTCEACVRPGPWLRKLVTEWEMQHA